MILDEKSWAWKNDVVKLALGAHWTVYDQVTRNQRQHAPSLVLVRGNATVLVFLRLGRKKSETVKWVERLALESGVVSVLWTPADRATIRVTIA